MPKIQRPQIASINSGAEFKSWYWKKSELINFCKARRIPYGVGKFDLIDRIACYIDGGQYIKPVKSRAISNFDWMGASLSKETIITDNYKNNRNVRNFFRSYLGESFVFSIDFMRWMKTHTGKTLGDAIDFYNELKKRKTAGYRPDIPEHNQYNAYLRAFTEDNPKISLFLARKCWQWKITQPSATGRHIYQKTDLKFCVDDPEES